MLKLRAAAAAFLALICAPLLAMADEMGSVTGGTRGTQSALMGCTYNSAAPALSTGQQVGVQCNASGQIVTAAPSGASANQVQGAGAAGSAVVGNPVLVAGSDGTNTRSIAVSTGGAVKTIPDNGLTGAVPTVAMPLGAGYNSTLPTYTNGQFGGLQIDSNGSVRARIVGNRPGGSDDIANTSIVTVSGSDAQDTSLRPLAVAPWDYDGSNWDRALACVNTAIVNVTAGSTTELVALSASTVTRVCSVAITMSAAGTAKFVYGTGTNCDTGTTDITGAFTLATGTPLALSAGSGAVFRTAASNALCLTAATGNVTGVISYARF